MATGTEDNNFQKTNIKPDKTRSPHSDQKTKIVQTKLHFLVAQK